jgi:carbonic anhydrase
MSLHSSEECRVAACLCHGQADAGELRAMRDANAIALSRRGLLRAALTGTAAGVLAGTGLEVLAPTAARAQSTLSPEAALQTLMDGNKRFIERRLTHFDEDLAILKQNTVEKQETFASVLSCADPASRSSCCLIRALAISSSTASPATSPLPRSLPASNMASPCWGRG